MMDEPMLDEVFEDRHPAPKLPGFTPVNRPGHSDTAPNCPKHEDAVVKSKSVSEPRDPKRRKIHSSAATTAIKPRKDAGSKKTKRVKTAVQLDYQDIAQGLPRTKPTSSGVGALPVKARSSSGNSPFVRNPGLRRLGDTSVEHEVKPAINDVQNQSKPSALVDKYQAAYTNVQGNFANQANSHTPPKSDEVEVDLNYNECHGQNFATRRQVNPPTYIEPSIQKNPESYGSITIRDFGAPPFTQTSPPTSQDRIAQGKMMRDLFDPLDSMSDDFIEVDDVKCGNHHDEGDLVMGDECLDKMMQSTAVSTKEVTLDSDWRSPDFSDETLYIDEQLENDQSDWPGAIPHSDGLAIYDEDATLVASELTDVPSSPQWSSQASCILTHVTSNANTYCARTSEGSENCFDDHELDDSLIDLMVDGSKSLQVTSPVTPAKRPLSPKLKWLSPKTYKPRKSSQIPVSSTNDPHLVPVYSNGDALPFMRPPFPKAVRDRSPILGLTNRTLLRICFRIGEALNAAAAALRTNVDAIIELYARVVYSAREASGGYKQVFQFGDLFTDKPPYISGTYIFWKGVEIWDHDSRKLVGEHGRGKMVRVLGRIKKREPGQGQGPGVEMVVLSIWEVDWEDVGVAKGIACPKEN